MNMQDGIHPTSEELLYYTSGDMSGVKKKTLRRHLGSCSSCAEALKILVEIERQLIACGDSHRTIRFQGDAMPEMPLHPVAIHRTWRRKRTALMTALSAAAAVLTILLLSGRVWHRGTESSHSMPGLSHINNPSRYARDPGIPSFIPGGMPSGSSISLASFSLPEAPHLAPIKLYPNPQKGEVS